MKRLCALLWFLLASAALGQEADTICSTDKWGPPWGMQLAFGISKSAARDKFSAKTRACASLVKDQTPDLVFEKSRASPKGGYFMARLGRDSRDQAWRDCARMKAQGCICAVYANR